MVELCLELFPRVSGINLIRLMKQYMCSWAMRCMLIEDNGRLVLIDNGIGDKQDAKFFSYYFSSWRRYTGKSLNNLGFTKGRHNRRNSYAPSFRSLRRKHQSRKWHTRACIQKRHLLEVMNCIGNGQRNQTIARKPRF